jgi:acyl-coenzyme A synthetase/AMP-(fatty) acid ligase
MIADDGTRATAGSPLDDGRTFAERLGAAPELPFIIGGVSRGALHGLALELRDRLLGLGPAREPVCLATDDRVAVAAAVLASLAGGPPLVVPHAATPQALVEAREATGFRRALGDDRSVVPVGVELLRIGAGMRPPQPFVPSRPLDEPFVRLYTGGSTGAPQAWSKTPRNLLAEACYMTRRFGFVPADRIVATVSPRHIYGMLFSVLAPLVSGAAVLRETPFFPAAIAAEAARVDATVLVSVPAQVRALGATAWTATGLRLALSSTASLAAAESAAFAANAGVGVTEIYGSTETGGIAARCRATGESTWSALDGVEWRLVRGRLHVLSPYLSPDLPRGRDGSFRTADRAVRAVSGFELQGRADGVVKVGGRRVDLGEIAERLKGLPGVSEAYVWSRDVSQGRGREIVALVAGRARPETLLRALRKLLPAAAVPRRIGRVERIPTTAAGKPDQVAADKLLRG